METVNHVQMERMPEDCYACLVGVWTGPESHSPGCDAGNDPAPVWPDPFAGPIWDEPSGR